MSNYSWSYYSIHVCNLVISTPLLKSSRPGSQRSFCNVWPSSPRQMLVPGFRKVYLSWSILVNRNIKYLPVHSHTYTPEYSGVYGSATLHKRAMLWKKFVVGGKVLLAAINSCECVLRSTGIRTTTSALLVFASWDQSYSSYASIHCKIWKPNI